MNRSRLPRRAKPSESEYHSKLNDLIRGQQWERVPVRIEKQRRVRYSQKQDERQHQHDNPVFRPLEIEYQDSAGNLPLHYAILFFAPLEVISALIDAYPDALLIRNICGEIPLHLACMPKKLDDYKNREKITEGRSNIIELLMAMEPKTITCQLPESEHHATPFQTVLEHDPPADLIKRMLDRSTDHPERQADGQRQLPLHIAVEYQANYKVVQLLANAYPEALTKKQNGRCLPLHIAATRGCTFKVLHLLLKMHPLGLEEKAKDKDTPLHIVFDEIEYRKKWTYETGVSTKENVLGVEAMVGLMLKYYFKDKRDSWGEVNAKTAVIHLLNGYSNDDKQSIMDRVEECHRICELPRRLYNYLKRLSSGEVMVDLGDSFMKRESTNVDNRESEEHVNQTTAAVGKRKRDSKSDEVNKRPFSSTEQPGEHQKNSSAGQPDRHSEGQSRQSSIEENEEEEFEFDADEEDGLKDEYRDRRKERNDNNVSGFMPNLLTI